MRLCFDIYAAKKLVPGPCWFACRFVFVFPWFSEGSDPRSAAACAVETLFSMLGIASKKTLILAPVLETNGAENHSENVCEMDVENKCCTARNKAREK